MQYQECADDGLVKLFLSGDNRALEALIARYEVKVFMIAITLTSESDLAKRIVEEVFVRLNRELRNAFECSIESLVHSISYDVSLEAFVGLIKKRRSRKEQQEFSYVWPGVSGELESALEAWLAEGKALLG